MISVRIDDILDTACTADYVCAILNHLHRVFIIHIRKNDQFVNDLSTTYLVSKLRKHGIINSNLLLQNTMLDQ